MYIRISIMYIHMYSIDIYMYQDWITLRGFACHFECVSLRLGSQLIAKTCTIHHHSKYCVAPWFVVVGLDSSGSKKDGIQKTGLKVLVESLSFFLRSWNAFLANLFSFSFAPNKIHKIWDMGIGTRMGFRAISYPRIRFPGFSLIYIFLQILYTYVLCYIVYVCILHTYTYIYFS